MRLFIALASSLVYIAIESVWIMWLLNPNITLELMGTKLPLTELSFVVLHIVASLLVTTLSFPFLKKRFSIPMDVSYWLYCVIVFCLFPFFGSLFLAGILTIGIGIKREKEIPYSTEDDDKELFKLFEFKTIQKTEQEMYEIVGGELEIEPFKDILAGGDTELKKGAINKLVNDLSPTSVTLLKMALKDDHPEIRLMASKAMSKIEETMNDDLLSATAKTKQDPKNMNAHNILAKTYLRYATVGILDQTTRYFYLERTINELLVSLQMDVTQGDTLSLFGKVLLMTQKYQKAEEIFKKILQKDPDNNKYRLLLCDALLGQCHLSEISKECQKITEKSELIEFWEEHERKDSKTSS